MVKLNIHLDCGFQEYFDYCKASLGEKFNYTKNNETAVFFKEGYDFLKEELSHPSPTFRYDESLVPDAAIRQSNVGKNIINRDNTSYMEKDNMMFVDRIIMMDGIIETNRLPFLASAYKNRLKHSKFEEVIGVRFCKSTDEGNLYHRYSGGIDLFGIKKDMPLEIRIKLENDLALALRELHQRKIGYHDPLPTNMRYDFKKVIFNPHNCITSGKDEMLLKNREFAVLFYTNPWINIRRFLNAYYGSRLSKNKLISEQAEIEDWMQDFDEGTDGFHSVLWERAKKDGKRKDYFWG